MKFEKFAVAYDGSDEAKHAVNVAIEFAKAANAELNIITVVRPPEGWWGLEGSPPTPQAMSTAIAAARVELLDPIEQAVDMDVKTVLEVGEPGAAIIEFCGREEIDCMFVGRRGAGVVERVMMGSVSDRIAHHAPCPVVIVP